jgi:hypothetical protein
MLQCGKSRKEPERGVIMRNIRGLSLGVVCDRFRENHGRYFAHLGQVRSITFQKWATPLAELEFHSWID